MLDRIKKYIVDNEFRLIFFEDKIYIINFDKILELTVNEVTIKESNKLYIIKGEGLSLKRLLEKEILISGKIGTIEVLYDK